MSATTSARPAPAGSGRCRFDAPRRADRHVAKPEAHPAHPGARDLRDPPVDHVRACCSRTSSAGRSRCPATGGPVNYSEFLMPGHLRPDHRLRLRDHGDRHGRRHRKRASSTGSARCRWRAPRSCRVDRSPTSSTTRGILIVLMVSGLFVGWTVRTGFGGLVAGVGLLAAVRLRDVVARASTSGSSVPTVEVANQAIFTVLFPITFISNVFVPPQTLPDWLQPDRGVEPDQHADGIAPPAVGEPESLRHRQLPVREPGPRDAGLGRAHPRGLRAARRPPLSEPEPLVARGSHGARRPPASAGVLQPGGDAVDRQLHEPQMDGSVRTVPAGGRAAVGAAGPGPRTAHRHRGCASAIDRWRTGAPSSSRSRPVMRRSHAHRAVVLGLDRRPPALRVHRRSSATRTDGRCPCRPWPGSSRRCR